MEAMKVQVSQRDELIAVLQEERKAASNPNPAVGPPIRELETASPKTSGVPDAAVAMMYERVDREGLLSAKRQEENLSKINDMNARLLTFIDPKHNGVMMKQMEMIAKMQRDCEDATLAKKIRKEVKKREAKKLSKEKVAKTSYKNKLLKKKEQAAQDVGPMSAKSGSIGSAKAIPPSKDSRSPHRGKRRASRSREHVRSKTIIHNHHHHNHHLFFLVVVVVVIMQHESCITHHQKQLKKPRTAQPSEQV